MYVTVLAVLPGGPGKTTVTFCGPVADPLGMVNVALIVYRVGRLMEVPFIVPIVRLLIGSPVDSQ